jgi:H+/Na+-translocating ferredoxin:NAD+ oxidoreductase subunit D
MSLHMQSAPQLAPSNTVSAVMLRVLIALLPAIAVHTWWFGWGMAVQLILASTMAVAFETLMQWARGRAAGPALSDLSAIVTAFLLVLCLPPLTPWWATMLGVGFALVFAKHLYGGLGQNPFNPAMVGYVFLLVSFPAELTAWIAPAGVDRAAPGLIEAISAIFASTPFDGATWDALSQATPLDRAREGLARAMTLSEIHADPRFAAQAAWRWLAAAYLVGGLFMLQQRIIRWHAPLAMLATLVILAGLGHYDDADRFLAPQPHLILGASVIAAFFIITDPVTGPASTRGRLIFGAGVGALIWVIRSFGGYPDGVAFAVLLMNMCVPIIDRYSVPRAYGHER